MIVENEIKVMLSSKNSSKFASKTLTDIRRDLKKYIEDTNLFGNKIFKVMINEDLPSQSASLTTWETCLKWVEECHILIVLYNGDSGWTINNGQIGICHNELSHGIRFDSNKTFIIDLGENKLDKKDHLKYKRDEKFRNYVKRTNRIYCNKVTNYTELKECVSTILTQAIVNLSVRKFSDDKKSLNHIGEALEWNKLDFYHRAEKIKGILRNSISDMSNSLVEEDEFFIKVEDKNILLKIHAIPSSFVISAREMVGQPFLEDHKILSKIKIDFEGPVHLIGCHKTVTESQAMKMLGFPDAVVIKTHFGLYVVDNVQKIQMIFIVNCTDTETIQSNFQQMHEWLTDTNEVILVLERAESRKKIIHVISEENRK